MVDQTDQSQIAPTEKNLTPLSSKDKKTQYGAVGTNLQMWYLTEDYNAKFNWPKKHDTYTQMYLSDSTVFKTLLSCELPIRSANRNIVSYSEKDGEVESVDDEIAEFVRKALFDKIDFEQFLFEALSFIRHGFSVFEKVHTIDNDGIRLKKLAFRKQKTIYQWQTESGEPGVQQYVYDAPKDWPNKGKTYLSIPANKLVILSFRKEGDNYEGMSLLRPIAKNRYIKDQLEKFETVKHERQGVGIPIAYMGEWASETDKASMLEIVTNVRANETSWIVMPGAKTTGWLFEFADMKSGQDSWLAEAIKRHNTAITDIMLGLFMKLWGEGKTGSYWMAESQIQFFILGLEAIAKQICSVVNKYVIKELVDMNFETEHYPSLSYWEIGTVNTNEIVTSATALVGAWLLTPDETLEQYMRKILDLPEKVAWQEEIEAEVPEKWLTPEEQAQADIEEENKKNIKEWEWKFFDPVYFNEVSKLINNDFIKQLQQRVSPK